MPEKIREGINTGGEKLRDVFNRAINNADVLFGDKAFCQYATIRGKER